MFAKLFRRRRDAGDFQREIEAHLQLEADRLREQGLGDEGARDAAHRAFGSVTRAQEHFYDSSHWTGVEDFCRDVRYAARRLRRSLAFTLASVAILGMAIGANAVAFGALNAVILRPLAVPQAQSLYALQPRLHDTSLQESYPDYLDLRNRNRGFDGLAAFNLGLAGLGSGGSAEPVWVVEASGNYFDVLRIRPYLGRFFHAADERGANSAPYAVLGYGYWRARFHADPAIVGRAILLNKHPFTVIGVAPPGFYGTIVFFSPQIFIPIVDEEQIEGASFLHARGTPGIFFGAMGHLKPGVSPAAAVADLNAIGADLNRTYPRQERPYSFSLKQPSLYGDFLGRPVRAFLTAVMVLAGLILLAACANLGGLFAARARDRSREIAMRLALGAGRRRILRQLFAEALLVALAGGGAGLWGSVLLLRWLSAWQPFPQFPIHLPVSPDGRVVVLALLLAFVSALLFAAAPIWRALRTDPYQGIKAGAVADLARRRVAPRELLLAAQVAICALLVTASMVALRGLQRTLHADFGFAPRHTLLVASDLKMAGYGEAAQPAMRRRMIAATAALPGVEAAGIADWVPLGLQGWIDEPVFAANATDLRPANQAADATVLKISPGYFRAAGTALLAGRDLSWGDGRNAPRVAVVNRRFARLLFGSPRRALGGHFKLQDGQQVEVVGIVEDGKYNSLTEAPQPAMFLPLAQGGSPGFVMVVRSRREAGGLAAAIRGRLRRLDSGLPVLIQPWSQAMNGALFPARVATIALGLLGLMGAILSIVGIFAVAAHTVSRRKRDLGIRMALGASRREVLRAAVGPALRLLIFGSLAGLLLGVLASGVLAAVVYAATPRDPWALAGVVFAMALVGLLATWIPAQRALAIQPAMLLRDE